MNRTRFISAIGTPLERDGSLCVPGFEAHMEEQWQSGVDGLLVAGTIGLIILLVLGGPDGSHAQEEKVPARAKVSSPLAPIEDDPALPRVLLIGDSISIGYTLPTREALAGKANVHRPPTNCGGTPNLVRHLDKWLGPGRWDVIHFNGQEGHGGERNPGQRSVQLLPSPAP